MSYASLTAKYRPQAFSQVAGQETVKTILSRAALEQKVAAAYLFSGTRGVGKTTLARIFAKALNCRNAPCAEPCNVCDQCRAITAGSAVDVVEIDGASNRGIDDVRRLKEVVGYAAMEGGYKIFIIDEAHMLSREAFNALLKTLEEPPARVTFVMATTEPHKFPATIISRCQHYVFKPLSEAGLVEHLSHVLTTEGVEFEDGALRLIARRGAGSVRDSMSLLGQVMALGDGKLTDETVRNVLGLAGQEAFGRLLQAFASSDALTLSLIVREMLDHGLDIGFFLRELSSLWRNLFMLRQSGEQALAVVDLPDNEARRYLEMSRDFSLQHIHACWQMTLEGQRRVLTSLEPSLALELLLLNLGMLPQLLSLEKLSSLNRRSLSGSGGSQSGNPAERSNEFKNGLGERSPLDPEAASGCGIERGGATGSLQPGGADPKKEAEKKNSSDLTGQSRNTPLAWEKTATFSSPAGFDIDGSSRSSIEQGAIIEPEEMDEPEEYAVQAAMQELDQACADDPAVTQKQDHQVQTLDTPKSHAYPPADQVSGNRSEIAWDTIFTVSEAMETPPWLNSMLRRMTVAWDEKKLIVEAHDRFIIERLNDPKVREMLEQILKNWCGFIPELVLSAPQVTRKTRDMLKAEVMEHPLVKEVQENFGGYVIDYGQLR